MTGLRKYVQENAEYVGPKFAEEARKIHYGEAAERHIYGETTVEEAQELVEEGVDVAPSAARSRRAIECVSRDAVASASDLDQRNDSALRRHHHVIDVHIGRQAANPRLRRQRNTLCFQDG